MIQARIRKRLPGFTLDAEWASAARTTVLFGASGAGKTLTLESIAGLVRPDEGRIVAGDRILFDSLSGLSQTPQQRRCGYVFQHDALFPHMTLAANLEFAAGQLARAERRARVAGMLDRFRLLPSAGRRPMDVSGGERQRCAIARALISSPRVLLLDEPARGLDAPLRAEFHETLRTVPASFDTQVILVTHDLDECVALGDYVVVMRAGRVAQTGTPGEVVDHPASLDVARLLGIYNLIPAEIRALDPVNRTSRVRTVGGSELSGPYFKGHLIGDHITLAVRPDELRVVPAGRGGANSMRLEVVRAVRRPGGMRLEFTGGIVAEVAASDYDSGARVWDVEVAPESFRAL